MCIVLHGDVDDSCAGIDRISTDIERRAVSL